MAQCYQPSWAFSLPPDSDVHSTPPRFGVDGGPLECAPIAFSGRTLAFQTAGTRSQPGVFLATVRLGLMQVLLLGFSSCPMISVTDVGWPGSDPRRCYRPKAVGGGFVCSGRLPQTADTALTGYNWSRQKSRFRMGAGKRAAF